MRLRFPVLCACVLLVGLAGCKDKAAPSSTSTTTGAVTPAKAAGGRWAVVAKGGSLASLVKAEVARAQTAGNKPVVYIGASWCPPCAAIKKYKNDPQMSAAFEGVQIIELDVDDWTAEDLTGLGYKATAVPVFIAVDAAAKAKGPTIDGGAWGDNVPKNMAPPLTKFFASI